MNERSLTGTVSAPSLRGFLEEASKIEECFRCLAFLEDGDACASFAQVHSFRTAVQAVGGILCSGCVDSWQRWRRCEGEEQQSRRAPPGYLRLAFGGAKTLADVNALSDHFANDDRFTAEELKEARRDALGRGYEDEPA